MVTKITVPDIIKKDEKILPETEKIIKEAESTIIKKSKEPIIQEYEISDILSGQIVFVKQRKKRTKQQKKMVLLIKMMF